MESYTVDEIRVAAAHDFSVDIRSFFHSFSHDGLHQFFCVAEVRPGDREFVMIEVDFCSIETLLGLVNQVPAL